MSDDDKTTTLEAFHGLMGAIVHLALRNGVSYREFSNLSKELYFSVSAQEYGLQGRPTNDSRIALMTGIERKEVKSLREKAALVPGADTTHANQSPNKLAKILLEWHSNPEYLDDEGNPLELMAEGPTPSFSALVQASGVGMAAVTVLREFKHSNVIADTDTGYLRVLKPYYVPNYHAGLNGDPNPLDPNKIHHGFSMLLDHLNTINYNLYSQETNQPSRFEMRTVESIPAAAIDEFLIWLNEQSKQFLQVADERLAEQVQKQDVPDENTERLGVGIYLIRGENALAGPK